MAERGDVIVDGAGDPIESARASIASFDVAGLSGGDLPVAVLRVERLLNAVHALSAELLERFERDGGWAAAWTAQRSGSARAGLRRRRRQGAALVQLPAVAAAARTGRLSTDHLRAMSDCVQRHPDLAAESEAV